MLELLSVTSALIKTIIQATILDHSVLRWLFVSVEIKVRFLAQTSRRKRID
jgi:hypothetical protein